MTPRKSAANKAFDLDVFFEAEKKKIETHLERVLPRAEARPADLCAAVRYAVLSGGKRIRPILALEACRAVGGNERDALPAAAALELIHSYSLVHDDLPCMDDDDVRRGQPTCHKKYGEVTALLAGDALLTLAFRVLANPDGLRGATAFARRLRATAVVAEAAGLHGMVGGQAVDVLFKEKEPDLPTIEYINAHKSGALIAAALEAGAILGGGTPREIAALAHYGRSIGLLFQVVDDILDREGYAKVIGVPEARKEAEELLERAKRHLAPLRAQGRVLEEIAEFILMRTS